MQAARWKIDRAIDGGRKEEVSREPAAMMKDVEVSGHYAQACVMEFRHQ
jgi:hypothetical protein